MNILVFCPNWIGDAVMATPTLRALRRRFPEARIDGLMRPGVAAALDGNPWLNHTILHDHRSKDPALTTWGVMGQIRQTRYDMGILLTNSFRTSLMAWLTGIRRRVGYAREGRGLLLNDRLRPERDRRGYIPSPVIDYYLALAYHVGAEKESYAMELFTSDEDERQADQLWAKFGFAKEEHVAVLNPGAAFGAAKRWPSEYFSDLARRLVDQHDMRVVILCGPSERGFARFIQDAALRPRMVRSLADEQVSLGLSKAIVRRASLLVSTDSGPRHFGPAFGVPVVSLFGPTHIEWTNTYFSQETMLQKKLPCGPCQQRVCPLGHLRCMTELSVDEVYQASVHRLASLPVVRRAS